LIDSSATRVSLVRDLDRERAARHRPVLKLRLLGRDRAEATLDGRRLQLSRRHSEIVALLSMRRGGMTSEELAADLYGDAGHAATVRVEVCRLRKLLGASIDAERYRLCMDVEWDVGAIRGLLEAGAVREAAERYEGQLLPHSEAPGVVWQRDALDAWIRHAVMTADDGAALWAWLQSPSGCEDLPAWKRLLAHLDFHDPRRSLAATRVRSLRDAYAVGPGRHRRDANVAPSPLGRLDLAPVGGEPVLPSGARTFAESAGHEAAFVVRKLGGRRAPRRRARDELRMLADEQAALRRLATAVARDASPAEIFAAIAAEIGPLLGADDAAVARFELDRTATVVAGLGERAEELGVGTRVELDDSLPITAVFRTGRSARVDEPDYSTASGPIADYLRSVASCSVVAGPIVVEARVWGAIVASTQRDPLPADTEERMASFAALVGIVIANAESRTELTASRARLAAAGDDARRIQRDLHDGAQQRLASTVIALKLAQRELGDATEPAVELVDEALAHAEAANRELRELAHGIMPAALSRGGLRAGIAALVSRVRLPVSVDVTAERLPAALEASAYFIVAEALTNAVRHARARSARITAVVDGGVLWLEVRDDGVGGARSDGGFGLAGLRDRATALNGELRVESPPGEGTVVAATLPVPASRPA
jgi:signal transduction histidine kinase